jgi:hypothetical protein
MTRPISSPIKKLSNIFSESKALDILKGTKMKANPIDYPRKEG